MPSLPNCEAESRQKYRTEYDKATNTARRVFILPSDEQRAALAGVVDVLRARLAKSEKGVCTALLEALKHMPRQKGVVEDWASFFRQAEFDLGEFSATHLQEALAEYRKTETFYPTIAAINAICTRLRSYDEFRLRRVLESLNGSETPSKKNADEDRCNGPRDFSTVYAMLKKRQEPKVEPAPVAANRAETDAAELRAKLAGKVAG